MNRGCKIIKDKIKFSSKKEFNITIFFKTLLKTDTTELTITSKSTYANPYTTDFTNPASTETVPATIISFNQLSSTQALNLLSSNYDMSDCIVNCTNHGSCVFDTLKNGYKCSCREHYSGLSCRLDTRACSSSPCLNNATCVDVYINSTTNSSSLMYSRFNCECQKGFEGVYCENKINVCANQTCSGNGNCVDKNEIPECKCFKLFEGDKCEIQSNELKTIKSLISISSILAIVVIIFFYLFFIILDLSDYYMRRSKRRFQPRKKSIITRHFYIN